MKRTANFILLVLSLSLPSIAEAQTGWVRMPDGPWTNVDQIDFFNDTSGYVRTGGRIWTTNNGGSSWLVDSTVDSYSKSRCPENYDYINIVQTRVLSSYFRRDVLVFAGTRYEKHCNLFNPENNTGVVWIRRPGSSSWSESRLIIYRPLDQLFVFGDTIFISFTRKGASTLDLHYAIDGFKKSTNAGKTWMTIVPTIDSFYLSIVIAFENGQRGLAWMTAPLVDSLGDARLARTTDGGQTWQTGTNPFGSEEYGDRLYYAGQGRYVSQKGSKRVSTTDFGETWQLDTAAWVAQPGAFRDEYYSNVAGYEINYLDVTSRIEFTSDSGRSWVEQLITLDYLIDLSAPSERVAYAVGPNGLLYKTIDGGGRFADVKQVDVPETKLRAWSSGDEIIIEGAGGGEIRIFDLLGRLVRAGRAEPLGGMQPGVYVVVSRGESVTVLVSP